MTRTPMLCAGLESSRLNAVCARRTQCTKYANWWETTGVQFNLCGPTGQPFKHFTPVQQAPTDPQPVAIGQTLELFS